MSLFRKLINKVWNKQTVEKLASKEQGILIKPDGTWVIAKDEKKKQQNITNPPNMIRLPPMPVLGKDYRFYDTCAELENLSSPPEYFPHGQVLQSKLDRCVELEAITSYTHKQTSKNTYILSIEFPCGDDPAECTKKLKLFIKAMEEAYKLRVIQQEKINSIVSGQDQYLAVFEYDPKSYIIESLLENEE